MFRTLIAVVVTIGVWLPAQAGAAVSLTEWGATARTDSADCTGGVGLDCSSVLSLPLEDGQSVGGAGDTTATIGSAAAGSATGLQGRGTAGAEVVIPAAGLAIPVLRARAESTDGDGFVSGAALGVQGYQFTGADGTVLSLDANLTGTVVNPGVSSVTGLEANIWILSNTGLFTFPAATTSTSDIIAGIIVNSILEGGGFDPFVATLSWDAASTGTGAINRSTAPGGTDPGDRLSFTVDNGDEFYLFAAVSAGAVGVGASALSWSTLTLDFDSTDLLAASVPVPAAVWFMGSGLIGLLGLRTSGARRRSRLS